MVFEEWLTELCHVANADPEFRSASQGLTCRICWEVEGKARYPLRFSGEGLVRDAAASPCAFTLRAPGKVWERLLQSVPPPGSQSLTALQATEPSFSWGGDMQIAAQTLHALNRLVELGRELKERKEVKPRATEDGAGAVERDLSLIIGRYVDLPSLDGAIARVYYEEAGEGPPLLLLHTAGADSRQFHDILSDRDLASRWHMFAFDLPYHGRSTPPDGWWRQPYRLTTEAYAHWCTRFIQKVIQCRAAVMGCSMGGAIVVYLAARHRADVAGVIGVGSPDQAPGRRSPYLKHPHVNQAAYNPSYSYGLIAPQSPERLRRRSWWYYSQGGYGVYSGDLHFYSGEWDASQFVDEIDTERCPVYFLTGEYDYSASPRSTQRLADKIPGAHFQEMTGLGHFPMTENPNRFRAYVWPIFEALRVNGDFKSAEQDGLSCP